jgi:hypothetical protein
MSIFLDIIWHDDFIGWDPEESLGITQIYVDPDLVWTPDFQLYNTLGIFLDSMVNSDVICYSDGSIWWSRPGEITFSCKYSLSKFPYDSQRCSATFGSFKYWSELLVVDFPPQNFSYISDDIPSDIPDAIVGPNFESSEWNIDGVYGLRCIILHNSI